MPELNRLDGGEVHHVPTRSTYIKYNEYLRLAKKIVTTAQQIGDIVLSERKKVYWLLQLDKSQSSGYCVLFCIVPIISCIVWGIYKIVLAYGSYNHHFPLITQ